MRATNSHVGKRVVDSSGEPIGWISGEEAERLYVEPDPDITGTRRRALGWVEPHTFHFVIETADVASITDERIELR